VYLKSLTLKGFKSFAEPATLVFEPGLTVVVGPNGSGKSNVVDAVAWVLGAQGPRTVRSSRMDDVIFAGTASRPALGRAEVSLTIDNRSGALPGGLAEITITRTLFRSGESEYQMNGEACRLVDIQDLLADSGVGRQQHVIVGQGQLDQILNAKPEDRRAVIEEAAGALKHRRRREKAERRLDATDENLERLGDLVREVRRQMRPLERQAEAAKRQEALSAERRAIRGCLLGRDLRAIDQRMRSRMEALEEATSEHEQLASQMRALDEELSRLEGMLTSGREGELASLAGRARSLLERSKGISSLISARCRSLQASMIEAESTDVVSALEAEASRIAAELEAAGLEEEELRAEARSAEELAKQAEAASAALAALEGRAAEARAATEALEAARSRLGMLERQLEKDRGLLESLEGQERAASDRHVRAGEESARHEAEIEELGRRADRLRVELEELKRDAEAKARLEAEAKTRRRQAEADLHRLEARAEALMRAAEEARGDRGGEALSGLEGALGVLADLLEVDEGWSRACAAALGSELGAFVLEGRHALMEALQTLEHGDLAASLLLVEARASANEGGQQEADLFGGLPRERCEALRRHVRARVPSVERLLDRMLEGVVVARGSWADAAELALERPGLVVVTKDGDRFSRWGWHVRTVDAATSMQAANEALRAGEAGKVRLAEAEAAEEQARAEAASAQELALAAERELERAEARRKLLEEAMRRLRSDKEASAEELSRAASHREELAARVASSKEDIGQLTERLAGLEREAREAEALLGDLEAARSHARHLAQRAAASERDLAARQAGLAERRRVLSSRLQDVERRLAGRLDEIQAARSQRRRMEEELTASKRLGDRAGELLAMAEQAAARLEAARNEEAASARSGSLRAKALRDQRNAAAERAQELAELSERLKVEHAEDSIRRESLVETLSREAGISSEEALGYAAEADGTGAPTAELKERLAAVEAEIERIGPVNPLALAELEELSARHRFLEEQVDDVRKARRDLKEVIRTVDDEVVRLFGEAFADVSEHFSDLLGTMFPGGSGRLVLTDPANLLETGIEVEARPAGKNVRKLSLLSGGERSLVALAFLFAVFRSRPSPFYVMDEVEAALDDVNLHRFIDLLHAFRSDAQLIVVSHQKRTMESADVLYGVTMTPGGSSKVVSQRVRPSGAEEPAFSV